MNHKYIVYLILFFWILCCEFKQGNINISFLSNGSYPQKSQWYLMFNMCYCKYQMLDIHKKYHWYLMFNMWVSEWAIVVLHQFSNYSAISWREQVNFQWDDDEVSFVLDQHAELDFYSASSLKQQSAGRHVALLGHIILIPSWPVFALSP